MTQKEKELLLKDLCARLPYGVKFGIGSAKLGRYDLTDIDVKKEKVRYSNGLYADLERCKPYLRSMSSMTAEEFEEYGNITEHISIGSLDFNIANPNAFDWLNAHHFDYRGLIEKGLAIEVTKENNPYEIYA